MGVTVTGSSELRATLEAQERRIREPEAALVAAAADLAGVLEETAAAEESPDGRAWARREMTSHRRDGRRAYPRRDQRVGALLHRSGRMLAGVVARAVGLAIAVDDGVPYVRFHQDGTRHMPARQILPAASMVTGPIGDWLARTARRLERYAISGEA